MEFDRRSLLQVEDAAPHPAAVHAVDAGELAAAGMNEAALL